MHTQYRQLLLAWQEIQAHTLTAASIIISSLWLMYREQYGTELMGIPASISACACEVIAVFMQMYVLL